MVKNKAVRKINRKKKAAYRPMVIPRPLGKRAAPASSEESTRLRRHVEMLVDPCNAELGPTAYRGQDGVVSRFKSTLSVGATAGKAGFIHVFYPAGNSIYVANINAGDGLPLYSSNAAGPGQSFLLSTAESQRVVGACSSCMYTGTELDRCGVIYSGVVPISVFDNIGTTYGGLASMLQHEARVGDDTLELKWSPDSAEESYWKNGSTPPGDLGGRNCLIYIGLGLNASTTSDNFQFVHTLVSEWLPSPGLGLGATNANSYDVPAGLEKVRTVISRMGGWWYGAARKVYDVATSPQAKMIASAVASLL